MLHNNYKNIRKYAAFIFMFFTVLSGSSDGIDPESIARLGRKALVDIIITNRLMMQDTRITIGQPESKSEADNKGLRQFLDILAEYSAMEYIIAVVAVAVISDTGINYLLQQKNIWKNAVF